MQSIRYDHFVPKNKIATIWQDISVNFTSRWWGIKANEQETRDGNKMFTYPLMVTEVTCGGSRSLFCDCCVACLELPDTEICLAQVRHGAVE
jgi:hypothetical protein